MGRPLMVLLSCILPLILGVYMCVGVCVCVKLRYVCIIRIE